MRFYFALARDGITLDAGGFVEAATKASAIRYTECTLAVGADVAILRAIPIPAAR